MRLCATWRQTPVVVPMTSGCQRAANKYRHASHETGYVVIYERSKSNEQSLRYQHFLGSSTERITLYFLRRYLYGEEPLELVQAQSCRATPCRLSMTVLSVILHTPLAGGRHFRTKPEDAQCLGNEVLFLRVSTKPRV